MAFVFKKEYRKKHYHLAFLLGSREWVLDKSIKDEGSTLMPSQNAPYPEMEYI